MRGRPFLALLLALALVVPALPVAAAPATTIHLQLALQWQYFNGPQPPAYAYHVQLSSSNGVHEEYFGHASTTTLDLYYDGPCNDTVRAWAKTDRHLAAVTSFVTNCNGNPEHAAITLPSGDADNDNVVGAQDHAIVQANFGMACDSPGYDVRSDLTYDCITNVSDFGAVKANFGIAGPAPFWTARAAADEPLYAYVQFWTYFEGVDTTQGCWNGRAQWVDTWVRINGTIYHNNGWADCWGVFTAGPFATTGTDLFEWRVKGDIWLAAGGWAWGNGVGTVVIATPNMYAGDCDGNNAVLVPDYNIMRNTFGLSCGTPAFDWRADFNLDCVVNVNDFHYIDSNFGYAGYQPLQ